MKKVSLAIFCLLLVSVFVLGQAFAQTALPADGVLISSGMDDGLKEERYWSDAQQMYYELHYNSAGELVKLETERKGDRGSANVTLGENDVRALASNLYPGATVLSVILERDDGLFEYKVYLSADTYQCVADFHPESGALLESRTIYTAIDASAKQAQAQALQRVQGGTVISFYEGMDDGRAVYKGEIAAQDARYSFEIDVSTGRFLEWEQHAVYNQPQSTSKPAQNASSSSGLIGTERAKEIALAKAGGGRVKKIKLDRDDGRQVYEGEVVNGNTEYDFEIDAETGAIIDWEVDD